MEREAAEIGEGMRTLVGHAGGDWRAAARRRRWGWSTFPASAMGETVWLCWRLADPEVAYWHGTDEGYASRKPW